MTALGKQLSAAAAPSKASAPAPVATRLFAALAGRRILRAIVIPGIEQPASLTLIGSERAVQLESEVLRELRGLELVQDLTTIAQYELARAWHFLAEAVREPIDPDKPNELPPAFGTASEWGQLAPSVVADVWRMYGDLSEEHDPASTGITPDELDEIRLALEKKNAIHLRSFGVRRLALYLLTTAGQPASSPTPTSPPGDGPPAS